MAIGERQARNFALAVIGLFLVALFLPFGSFAVADEGQAAIDAVSDSDLELLASVEEPAGDASDVPESEPAESPGGFEDEAVSDAEEALGDDGASFEGDAVSDAEETPGGDDANPEDEGALGFDDEPAGNDALESDDGPANDGDSEYDGASADGDVITDDGVDDTESDSGQESTEKDFLGDFASENEEGDSGDSGRSGEGIDDAEAEDAGDSGTGFADASAEGLSDETSQEPGSIAQGESGFDREGDRESNSSPNEIRESSSFGEGSGAEAHVANPSDEQHVNNTQASQQDGGAHEVLASDSGTKANQLSPASLAEGAASSIPESVVTGPTDGEILAEAGNVREERISAPSAEDGIANAEGADAEQGEPGAASSAPRKSQGSEGDPDNRTSRVPEAPAPPEPLKVPKLIHSGMIDMGKAVSLLGQASLCPTVKRQRLGINAKAGHPTARHGWPTRSRAP